MPEEDPSLEERTGTADKDRPTNARRARKRTSDVTGDELIVRIFTLADHATVPPDGKLYIAGGGVDQMFVPQLPGGLGSLALAIRIRVPWHKTSESLTFLVRALDADRKPIGPDPIVSAAVEVGRAPGQRPGDEFAINLAIPLTGFPVQTEGTIFFHLSVAGTALAVLPLKVRRFPNTPTVTS
jgi:hypothetical protein